MKTSLYLFAPLMVVGVLTLGISTIGRSQTKLQTDFRNRIDSLHLTRMPHQMLYEMVKRNGQQRHPSTLRKVVSPQSDIYVIDTAIVRSLSDGSYDFGDTARHLYSFNANAKRTLDLTQRLVGDVWVDTLRQSNTYDASNNMLSYVIEYYYWYGHEVERLTYTYDSCGNRLSELFEGYGGRSWRHTYTYDASNNMLSQLLEWPLGDQWVSNTRWSYSYDASNNMLSQLVESWYNGQWGNSERHTYAYDASNNMLSDVNEHWSTGQWDNFERHTYNYNASNHMLSDLFEQWSTGEWVNDSRWSYTYDAGNNLLSALDEIWSNGQWENSVRQTFTYDGQRNVIEFWNYSWGGSSWVPANLPWGRKSGYTFYWPYVITDSVGNDYSYWGYNFTLTYRLIVTGVSSQSGNVPATYSLSQNYPNPFNPSTTIKYELPRSSEVRLTVFDMLGREVAVLVNERRDAGVHEVKYDASDLSSGVYFYRLQAGDFVQTHKLVVLK